MSKPIASTLWAFAIVGLVGLSSCASEPAAPEVDEVSLEQTQSPEDDQRQNSIKKIIYSIPSPTEMASLLMKSGVEFNLDLLNSTDRVDNYATSDQRAINLGIYGADLRYTSMYGQDQPSIYYAAAVKKLAKELGVEGAIDDDLYQRLEDNRHNRDSMLTIVSNSYNDLDAYLKENDRQEVSALVIAGGWLEGMYLACAHHTSGNDLLRDRIAEQKYVLGDLINLMDSYNKDEALTGIMSDLSDLNSLFDKVEIQKGKTETSEDESGTMVIGGKSTISLSEEVLGEISAKITEIRTKSIQ